MKTITTKEAFIKILCENKSAIKRNVTKMKSKDVEVVKRAYRRLEDIFVCLYGIDSKKFPSWRYSGNLKIVLDIMFELKAMCTYVGKILGAPTAKIGVDALGARFYLMNNDDDDVLAIVDPKKWLAAPTDEKKISCEDSSPFYSEMMVAIYDDLIREKYKELKLKEV